MATKVEFENDDGQVVHYVRHVNGGGLVAPGARVHEGAWVAATAYVEAGARVGDRSRIADGSWLDHGVLVGEDVLVDRNVHLGPRTRVHSGARIGAGARVGSDVVIGHGARLPTDAIVADGTVVRRGARSGRSDFGIAPLDRQPQRAPGAVPARQWMRVEFFRVCRVASDVVSTYVPPGRPVSVMSAVAGRIEVRIASMVHDPSAE